MSAKYGYTQHSTHIAEPGRTGREQNVSDYASDEERLIHHRGLREIFSNALAEELNPTYIGSARPSPTNH